MKCETKDLSQENIAKLAELFPSVVTEARDASGELRRAVNFEALRQLLSDAICEGDEAYEFTWPGKKASIVEAGTPLRKTLRPCLEESKDWQNTENLYIEGDNLEVLKLLQESYLGKIKMIYIDPPYNTGNDFVYRDNFRQDRETYDRATGSQTENSEGETERLFRNTDSNGRFHSDWCSMIYPRLLLARNLLSEDGVIFVSCDDNELPRLRSLLDYAFGEDNFRNTILVRRRIKSLNSQFADRGLQSLNIAFEYVLVYSKNDTFKMAPLRLSKAVSDEKGSWEGFWSNADRPTMRYDILGFTPSVGQWRQSKEKADIAVKNYEHYLKNYSDKESIDEYWARTGISSFIRRNGPGNGKNGGVQYWQPPQDSVLRTSNWTDIEVTQIAKEITLPFDNPKNKGLMIELCKLANLSDNATILDFFSGSATTAHAVMQLNAEDGGRRKFIMVQLPEVCDPASEAAKAGYKNICEIGKERIRRAGEKIRKDNAGKPGIDQLDTGFRVLKCDSANMKDVYFSPQETGQADLQDYEENIKPDRTDLDLLYGCLLEWGLPLSGRHEICELAGAKVHFYDPGPADFNAGNFALACCFAKNISEATIRAIAARKPLRAVFRDACFADSQARINAGELMAALSPNTAIRVI